MKNWITLALVAGMLSACSNDDTGPATTPGAGGGSAGITITAPENGATVAGDSVTVEYRVLPSPSGDHVHVFVDDRKPEVLRKLEGSYEVTGLEPGEHMIVIKEVNAGHTPTGQEAMVTVLAQ